MIGSFAFVGEAFAAPYGTNRWHPLPSDRPSGHKRTEKNETINIIVDYNCLVVLDRDTGRETSRKIGVQKRYSQEDTVASLEI